MIVDYDKGCIVMMLENGKNVTIPLNGVEFAAVSLKLAKPEYDMPTLGRKLKEFHDKLADMPENNMAGWLKEFIKSPRFDDGKKHEDAVSKLFTDVRKRIKALLGKDVSLALLPKSNKRVTYPLEKISFKGRCPYGTGVLEKTPGMGLSKDGTEIEFVQEGIKELKIPEGVIKLGGDILKKCSELISIQIPKSVTSINVKVFSDCKKLERIEVKEENPICKSKEGILFNKKGSKLVFVPRGKKGDIQIPEEVTEIGYTAFCGCTGITGITIPKCVANIGDDAFRGCTGLTSITIPNNVAEIKSGVFADCIGLKSITISESVAEIGAFAFAGCVGLKGITIPGSVKKIEEGAFCGCTGLIDITIPRNVTRIEKKTFRDCTELKSIAIPENVAYIAEDFFCDRKKLERIDVAEKNTVYKSVNGMLFDKGGTRIVFALRRISGDLQIPMGVTEIGEFAFAGCSELKSITIPESVRKIEKGALRDCIGLKSITISEGVAEIDAFAFAGCTGLKGIIIPESVIEIKDWTFSDCTKLARITIPESVTTIGEGAFSNCTGLISIKIPKSVNVINYNAFEKCTSLKCIEVEKENPTYKSECGMLLNKEGTTILFVANGKRTVTIYQRFIRHRSQ